MKWLSIPNSVANLPTNVWQIKALQLTRSRETNYKNHFDMTKSYCGAYMQTTGRQFEVTAACGKQSLMSILFFIKIKHGTYSLKQFQFVWFKQFLVCDCRIYTQLKLRLGSTLKVTIKTLRCTEFLLGNQGFRYQNF